MAWRAVKPVRGPTVTGCLCCCCTGIPVNAPVTTGNFQLFREPLVPRTHAQRRANANANTFDFLDPVEKSETWRITAPDAFTVRARSLYWPGFELTVTKGAQCRFQGIYFGYGESNPDLAFML